jgi:hypothetical protein
MAFWFDAGEWAFITTHRQIACQDCVQKNARIAYKKRIFVALSAVDDAILVPALAFSVLQRCCWQEFDSAWKEATATSAPLV